MADEIRADVDANAVCSMQHAVWRDSVYHRRRGWEALARASKIWGSSRVYQHEH